MTANELDDGDYPYSRRSALQSDSYSRLLAETQVWRWIQRCLIAGLGIVAVAAVAFSFLVYRVASQAWLVAELERLGCDVRYQNEPVVEGALPAFLREWFGDHWWSNVREVSLWSFGSQSDVASADDLRAICKACARLPRLQSFTSNNPHFSFQQIRDWPHLARIEELHVAVSGLSGSDLDVLARMRGLKKFQMNSVELIPEIVARLSELPRLEILGVSSAKSAARSAPLANPTPKGFAALKRLEIDNSPGLNDDAVVALGRLPALEEVVINRTPLGDRALEHLIASGVVRLLIMNQSRITDSGLRLVTKCPGPLSLHIADSQITDEGLRALAGKQFNSLALDNTAITDDGLTALGSLQGLSFLSLDGTKVSGAGLSGVDVSERVNWIRLEGSPVTREGLSVLANLNVDELCLVRTPLTDNDLLLFANSDNIASLDVKETKVTADGVRAFYESRKRRLAAAGHEEMLLVVSDFGGIAEQYLPKSEAWRIADAFQPQ